MFWLEEGDRGNRDFTIRQVKYYIYDSDCLDGRVKNDKLGGQIVVDQDSGSGACLLGAYVIVLGRGVISRNK